MLRRYVLSRVLAGIFGLIVFLTATFFMAKLLVPGDITSNFAVGFGGKLTRLQSDFEGLPPSPGRRCQRSRLLVLSYWNGLPSRL